MIIPKRTYTVLLVLLSAVVYYYIAFPLQRTDTVAFFTCYTISFLCFFGLIRLEKKSVVSLFVIALLFRLVFLGSFPNLSQDFYRFIWDGRLLAAGINPYLYLPNDLIASAEIPIAQAKELYEGMGALSASHYTNYPPLNQLCFTIAAWISGKSLLGSVIVLRIIIILADIGTFYFGRKLLKNLGLPSEAIWLYVLNPFIIMELTGNLHFEGVMVFFLVWSLYLLQQKRWFFAGILLACSISIKLIPLLFLPLFFQWFTQIRSFKDSRKLFSKNLLHLIGFYAVTLATVVLLFMPFASDTFIDNYQETVGLWFQNFEFNASLYYIARYIGYQIVGWNMIATIGKVIPILVFLFVLLLSFFRTNLSFRQTITALLFALSFYFFTTTTMHPWYLTTLLALSIFTTYRFPLVWSFVIVLSYSAYANNLYQENLYLVGLEYIIVYGFLFYELWKTNDKNLKLPSLQG